MYAAPALYPKRINIGLQSSAVEEVGSLLLLPGLERYDDALQDMDSDICASETLRLCAGEVGLLRNEVCQAKYDSANTDPPIDTKSYNDKRTKITGASSITARCTR